ncbi:acyl-CoA thioesterase II [Colwellia sp. 1_MG-2023]|jgi:acyl-CoA thioesterase-2|uniref:acyl-CoA thioesterase II n=1 Tax=unclassified Colwellia TaxID=196834 RepID=UPI001C08482F|nr:MULTISPECIES: acyl-CoA thioesterase II [unclassified Colwellia]MBU2923774.1 acyl-CoA thioesterase II [Colwellia sp. C2M11]MDO6654027.1 acyl-CoA thioesterase II [Colwellia sp. 3_MG-2023]MDO6667006.1 acyl-CoA thioesterase II [Colwellia sp. 2_MG-2023]MDO6691411.1 acyl-CoA thioesterase II [Colwellia sp. 1_MG-2023]
MSSVLNELLALLKLEVIEKGIYRGQSQDLGFRALFGGQVMGQALSAAQATIDEDRFIHSLHSYFLLAGDASKPVVYEVEDIRNGNSFSTRRVKAIQNGKAIFYMTASFQKFEQGFDHQDTMPTVPGPDGLASYSDFIIKHKDAFPQPMRDKLLAEMPIEIRPVQQYNWLKPEKTDSTCQTWLKTNGTLPDDLRHHSCMLAYASDFQFLPASLMPHGASHFSPNFQIATVDHAMWFHRPFRFDDWLLYCIDSPSASNGRGLVRGQIYNRKGELVASTMQEGVIRQR